MFWALVAGQRPERMEGAYGKGHVACLPRAHHLWVRCGHRGQVRRKQHQLGAGGVPVQLGRAHRQRPHLRAQSADRRPV